jgi:hypothetical protein
MKKLIALLFLSLLVSQVNAVMMPINSRAESSAVAIPGHDHCQDASLVSVSEDGKSSSNANVAHYCCAVVAILVIPPEFSASNQVDVYLQGNVSRPASNIVESIYKPPRNYL